MGLIVTEKHERDGKEDKRDAEQPREEDRVRLNVTTYRRRCRPSRTHELGFITTFPDF